MLPYPLRIKKGWPFSVDSNTNSNQNNNRNERYAQQATNSYIKDPLKNLIPPACEIIPKGQ